MQRYAVGIDLGTTHCVMAASELLRPDVEIVPVPQLVAPGESAPRALLPSFMFLSGPPIVGELARRLGAGTPNKLVASAKSWLCQTGVDRRSPLLPWSAPDSEPHVSPYDAEVAYLQHLRRAWDAVHGDALLAEQDVVVTVPASFDDGARELTLGAACDAGLGNVRLLEEPQAAFYDYLGAAQRDLGDAKLILVVDVGGGTTDLTLLRVLPGGELERVAVGGHLMLGGDNMDATLAHFVLERAGIERRLDPSEWSALIQAARDAKERLLGVDAPQQATLSLSARGSGLVAGTRSIVVERDDVLGLLVDGFVPFTEPTDVAQRGARSGLTTLGLPYTSDPALPRHIATFLRRHEAAARASGARVLNGLPRPDHLLLNGGVFKAHALTSRLCEVLTRWYGEPVPLLEHTSLDTAVAKGAVRYILARRGVGRLIGGGSARAYYLGVGEARAVCIAPRGMQEGASVEVRDRTFELVVDERVSFPLYAYTGDRVDKVGDVLGVSDELELLQPLTATLRKPQASGRVPVRLGATLGESGALELSLASLDVPPHRWRLSFGREGAAERKKEARPPSLPRMDFESDPMGVRGRLEEALGPRGTWSAATCRALADVLLRLAPARTTSAQHELSWLRLTGFCLRPGSGAPGDDERVDRLWALYDPGLIHPTKAHWSEWWIVWRRVAAGLDVPRRERLLTDLARSTPGRVEKQQLAAALERADHEDTDAAQVVGESLPEGLRLL